MVHAFLCKAAAAENMTQAHWRQPQPTNRIYPGAPVIAKYAKQKEEAGFLVSA